MSIHAHISAYLLTLAQGSTGAKAIYYKVGEGDYAQHDKFIGVNVPTLRKAAKEFPDLNFSQIESLLASAINEERLLALLILVTQYQKGAIEKKEKVYSFYLDHLPCVNNWNLVDSSAHLILGAHLLLSGDKEILLKLASSSSLWDRRIAIVSTWYFIRNNQFEWTIKIAQLLLNDDQDLIHKAVGWMLREVGKKEEGLLKLFLEKNTLGMPRTMLRYAIEKFSEEERRAYLLRK